VFEHKTLGMLGRIVLSQIREQEMLLQPELYQGQDKPDSTTAKKKKAIFKKVVATVHAGFEGNFPRPVSSTISTSTSAPRYSVLPARRRSRRSRWW
jgi:hypothetical protein